jgi:hypothetical protein
VDLWIKLVALRQVISLMPSMAVELLVLISGIKEKNSLSLTNRNKRQYIVCVIRLLENEAYRNFVFTFMVPCIIIHKIE